MNRSLRRRLVFGCGLIVACLLAVTLLPARDKYEPMHTALADFMRQLGYASIKLERSKYGNDLLGDGVFDGQKRRYLFDSGCAVTRIAPSLRKHFKSLGELDAEMDDRVLGKLDGTNTLLIEKVELGQVAFANQPAWELKRMGFGAQKDAYDVMLGCDLMLRNRFLLDCVDGRLYCQAKELKAETLRQFEETMRASGYCEVPVTLCEETALICQVKLNGESVPMAVDTGAHSTVIDDTLATRLNIKSSHRGMSLGATAEIGSSEDRIGTVNSLEVGNLSRTNVQLSITQLDHWGIGEKSSTNCVIQGLIGADFLVRYQVIIDFDQKRLWMRKPLTEKQDRYGKTAGSLP